MPENTPDVKVRSVQNLGGEYVTMVHYGSNFDAALTKCNEMREQDKQLVYVPPFDDPLVIAGQGTIGLEILSQMHMVGRTPDAIFCPVGGGGLLAGIISYVRSFHRTANIKVVGVESNNADAMTQSLEWHRELTKDPELGRPLQVELDELKLEKLELEQRKLKLELERNPETQRERELKLKLELKEVERKLKRRLELEFKLKGIVTLAQVDPFSDGTAVGRVGEETFRIICQEIGDKFEMIKVSNDDICEAIMDIFEGDASYSHS